MRHVYTTWYLVARALTQGSANLSQIAARTGVPRETVWHHLRAFMKAGLVARTRRKGSRLNPYLYRVVADNFMEKAKQVKVRGGNSMRKKTTAVSANGVRGVSCLICRKHGKVLMLFSSLGRYVCLNCLLMLKPIIESASYIPRNFPKKNRLI